MERISADSQVLELYFHCIARSQSTTTGKKKKVICKLANILTGIILTLNLERKALKVFKECDINSYWLVPHVCKSSSRFWACSGEREDWPKQWLTATSAMCFFCRCPRTADQCLSRRTVWNLKDFDCLLMLDINHYLQEMSSVICTREPVV